MHFLIGGFPLQALIDAVPEDRLTVVEKLSLARYPETYARIDIGCCPLADEPFNLAKSPIKCFELAAAGAVVLASPVVYGGVIEHDISGLICASADEWEDGIARMVEQPELRASLASHLLERVVREHSLQANAHLWPAAWSALVGQFRVDALRRSLREPLGARALDERFAPSGRSGGRHG